MARSENKSLVVAAIDDTIEVLFNQRGTDTIVSPFKWFYNLDKPAKAVIVKCDKILQITEVNNEVWKSPFKLAANGSFADSLGAYTDMKYTQIKVKITETDSEVEIFGRI